MTLTYFMASSTYVAYPRSHVSVYRTIDSLVSLRIGLAFVLKDVHSTMTLLLITIQRFISNGCY